MPPGTPSVPACWRRCWRPLDWTPPVCRTAPTGEAPARTLPFPGLGLPAWALAGGAPLRLLGTQTPGTHSPAPPPQDALRLLVLGARSSRRCGRGPGQWQLDPGVSVPRMPVQPAWGPPPAARLPSCGRRAPASPGADRLGRNRAEPDRPEPVRLPGQDLPASGAPGVSAAGLSRGSSGKGQSGPQGSRGGGAPAAGLPNARHARPFVSPRTAPRSASGTVPRPHLSICSSPSQPEDQEMGERGQVRTARPWVRFLCLLPTSGGISRPT